MKVIKGMHVTTTAAGDGIQVGEALDDAVAASMMMMTGRDGRPLKRRSQSSQQPPAPSRA